MAIIRARTQDLKQLAPVTKTRAENTKLNIREASEGKAVLASYPQRIVLEMTSTCNIRCKMCGRSARDFAPTVFDPAWLDIFEPAVENIEEVTLLGWGEPTLHPRFSDFLRWGRERGLRIFFCTNGTRLEGLIEDIFRNHVDLLTVSLDGAKASTNDSIRRGASFAAVTQNIRAIVREKARLGVPYPYLSIVMTMMDSNFREFPDYVRLAADLGVQEAKGVYLTVFEERLMDECMEGRAEELRDVFSEAERLGEELGIAVKLPYLQGADIAGDKPHKDCFTAWRDFFLGSDGYVRSCMSTPGKLFHVSKYAAFDEMWNSPEYQDFRRRVNTPAMDEPCARCYQASFANWNRTSSFVQVGEEFSPRWEK